MWMTYLPGQIKVSGGRNCHSRDPYRDRKTEKSESKDLRSIPKIGSEKDRKLREEKNWRKPPKVKNRATLRSRTPDLETEFHARLGWSEVRSPSRKFDLQLELKGNINSDVVGRKVGDREVSRSLLVLGCQEKTDIQMFGAQLKSRWFWFPNLLQGRKWIHPLGWSTSSYRAQFLSAVIDLAKGWMTRI